MKVVQLVDESEIYNCLVEFNNCFPHLKEKIPNLLEFAKKLTKNAIVIVSRENGINTGMSAFYANDTTTPNYGYLTLIGVRPNYRGMKIGKLLLNTSIEIMKSRGMHFIKLEVDLDNTSAQEFYKRNLFIVAGKASKSSIYLERKI